ncbi:MAG: histone deacetylase family protein [Burkholderiaceae bacterium]|nr:histone deacetylase family protein [Burkholderiaceae bacterium]
MKTAYLTHPSSLRHEMGPGHPECPERVSAISDRLLAHGVIELLDAHDAPAATGQQVERAHSARYFAELRAASPAEGYRQLDPDTAMNRYTFEAALHAAGAAVRAADLVIRGEALRAFCNVRPPGHHAERGSARGFCFINNVAVGIRHALDAFGLDRVALVDFDVHHGNGSEDIFAGDERVLMVSSFQSRLYPFMGETPRASNMRNVGLRPYSDGTAMRRAVRDQWLPALRAFAPQMLFVSAGFDAHRDDDMSQLAWSDDDYRWVSAQLVAIADELCEGRIVSMLEGGYDLDALARCAELHVRALAGID